jgi:hypothetical protein
MSFIAKVLTTIVDHTRGNATAASVAQLLPTDAN